MTTNIISEFFGVQIGNQRFSEHAKSLVARRGIKDPENQPEPFYAYPGCGTPNKHEERVYTLKELQTRHKGPVSFISGDKEYKYLKLDI